MLHAYPQMTDITVDHWRNLQYLLLESAKEKRRIIIIHENGEILKFVHSQRLDFVRSVDRVDDPHAVAEQVYKDNAEICDFVAVFERRGFNRYFGEFQDTWKPTEDLDTFVHRQYASMDEFADEIVTYPGPARTMLGLQWRFGASYEQVLEATEKYVVPNTSVIFGIFEEDHLWASLVLRFDADRRAYVVTTADPTEISIGTWKETAKELVDWMNAKFPPCSLGFFTDLQGAKELLSNPDKIAVLKAIAQRGKLLVDPIPESISAIMG